MGSYEHEKEGRVIATGGEGKRCRNSHSNYYFYCEGGKLWGNKAAYKRKKNEHSQWQFIKKKKKITSRGTFTLFAVNPSVTRLKLEGRNILALLQFSHPSESQPIMCTGFIRCRCQFGAKLASRGSRAIQRPGAAAAAPESRRRKKMLPGSSRHPPNNPTKKRTESLSGKLSPSCLVFLANSWNKTYHLCDITVGTFQILYLLAFCKVKQASNCPLMACTDRPETHYCKRTC